jgi:hypothetical protein
MKTSIKNYSESSSKTIVAIKVMAFLSWLIYIGFAFANNMMLEAFIFSVGFVILGYFLFVRASQKKQVISSSTNYSQASKNKPANHNYLDVFFHNSHQVKQINTMK